MHAQASSYFLSLQESWKFSNTIILAKTKHIEVFCLLSRDLTSILAEIECTFFKQSRKSYQHLKSIRSLGRDWCTLWNLPKVTFL